MSAKSIDPKILKAQILKADANELNKLIQMAIHMHIETGEVDDILYVVVDEDIRKKVDQLYLDYLTTNDILVFD